MWRRYVFGSVDILQLLFDGFGKSVVEALRREEFYGTPEQILEKEIQLHEFVERFFAWRELDEQIDVAVGACLLPDERTEQCDGLDVECVEVIGVCS